MAPVILTLGVNFRIYEWGEKKMFSFFLLFKLMCIMNNEYIHDAKGSFGKTKVHITNVEIRIKEGTSTFHSPFSESE